MKQNINNFLKRIRHSKPTYVLSLDDEPVKPDDYIVEIVSEVLKDIQDVDYNFLKNRFDKKTFKWLNTWPGEHYKFLTCVTKFLKPDLVIEVGTFKGASCLAMKHEFCGKIITYDVVPWSKIKGTHLREEDFDNKLEQRIIDFSNINQIRTQRNEFKNAYFIFVDMAKDGVSEKLFCDYLDSLNFDKLNAPFVVFDDIRFNSMLEFWRNINHPKMDITSIGHWSGTGIVHWV